MACRFGDAAARNIEALDRTSNIQPDHLIGRSVGDEPAGLKRIGRRSG
jgi:hypothetical protein